MSKPKKGGKGKGKKEAEIIDDEFTNMPSKELKEKIEESNEILQDLRAQRNYFQLDRDMVGQFYQNVLDEISEIQVKILNKEAFAEKMEKDHQVEVKAYMQKVKHLEYEQEQKNQTIQKDAEEDLDNEKQFFSERLTNLMKEKNDKKKDLNVKEEANEKDVEKKNDFNNGAIEFEKQKYATKIDQHIQKYEKRLKQLKEELSLKLKVELHELEERKNLHINELMTNHEDAFTELKRYYNDITRENLQLIKAQQQDIKRIGAQLIANTKLISELREKNEALKKPLEEKKRKRDEKLNKLKQFEKDKMSKDNLNSKLKALQLKSEKLLKDKEELDRKYESVTNEKLQLEQKFETIANEVKQHSELQNLVLSQNLMLLESQLSDKEAQLLQIIEKSNLDKNLYKDLSQRIQESIENKNNLIKNLKYSIQHATKAYNDAIRVYEAKLVEFGIPAEELGFQILETNTSTMPAGLVSS